MSELKTLKDLFGSKDHCLCAACGEGFKCDIEIIRQEAIKIIKYLENKDEVIYDGEKLERHYGFYDLTLFKLFFNITEEDLECTCTEYIKGTFADCPIHRFTRLEESE